MVPSPEAGRVPLPVAGREQKLAAGTVLPIGRRGEGDRATGEGGRDMRKHARRVGRRFEGVARKGRDRERAEKEDLIG